MKANKPIKDYAPEGTKSCLGLCLRKVVMTPEGPIVICEGCTRIVIDNREK